MKSVIPAVFGLLVASMGLGVEACPAKCPEIISRQKWGAVSPTSVHQLSTPVPYAIIAHTVTPECRGLAECKKRLQNMQEFHMSGRHFDDIIYNFLVSSDGQIFEGRGFTTAGAHTHGHNADSICVAFIGNFSDKAATPEQIQAAQSLLECALGRNSLATTYKVVGARQFVSTISPGDQLYQQIQKWPHWTADP